jgi:hypothetical protein
MAGCWHCSHREEMEFPEIVVGDGVYSIPRFTVAGIKGNPHTVSDRSLHLVADCVKPRARNILDIRVQPAIVNAG